MGQRGPQPKPTAQRRLEGNPANRPLNEIEVQPVGEVVCPPQLTGAVARKFDEVAALMPVGFYTAADIDLIASYAVAWSQYWQCVATLATDGQTTTGSQGQKVAHPCVALQKSHWDTMKQCGDRLGLSPAARTRLQMPEGANPHGEFAGLIGGTRTRASGAHIN